MASKQTNKRRREKRAEWTVEPVRPIERDELIEQFVRFVDAARRRILPQEDSIR